LALCSIVCRVSDGLCAMLGVSAWLNGLRSPFTGDIDTPWVVDADDHEILRRLTNAAEYNSGKDLWLVIREWTVFKFKSVDVQTCRSSCRRMSAETAELIDLYFRLSFSYREILQSLAQNHGIIISMRTLKQILRYAGKFRRTQKSDVLSVAIYIQELLTGWISVDACKLHPQRICRVSRRRSSNVKHFGSGWCSNSNCKKAEKASVLFQWPKCCLAL